MDWQLLMCYTYVCFRVLLLEIKLLLLAYKDIKYILKDNIKKKSLCKELEIPMNETSALTKYEGSHPCWR